MTLLHVTPERNIKSIFKHGLLPHPPFLSQFSELVKHEYGKEYDERKGVIFTFSETVLRDKHIKDTVYWKLWGTPRNQRIDHLCGFKYRKGIAEMEQWNKLCEMGPTIFQDLQIREEGFVILQVEAEAKTVECLHAQYPEMSSLWSDMDIRYEHHNLPLVLSITTIPPARLKIRGKVIPVIPNNGKINFNLKI